MFLDLKFQYFRSVLPNLIYRLDAILTKTPASYFIYIDMILKIIWRSIRLRIAKATLKEKIEDGRLTLPDFKTYYKATVIKIVCYWQKDRSVEQNR